MMLAAADAAAMLRALRCCCLALIYYFSCLLTRYAALMLRCALERVATAADLDDFHYAYAFATLRHDDMPPRAIFTPFSPRRIIFAKRFCLSTVSHRELA